MEIDHNIQGLSLAISTEDVAREQTVRAVREPLDLLDNAVLSENWVGTD